MSFRTKVEHMAAIYVSDPFSLRPSPLFHVCCVIFVSGLPNSLPPSPNAFVAHPLVPPHNIRLSTATFPLQRHPVPRPSFLTYLPLARPRAARDASRDGKPGGISQTGIRSADPTVSLPSGPHPLLVGWDRPPQRQAHVRQRRKHPRRAETVVPPANIHTHTRR